MKKYIFIFLIFAVFLTGCKEIGTISNGGYSEAYYVQTDYSAQSFSVINAQSFENKYLVTFTTNLDSDCSQGIYSPLIEPNTYVTIEMTASEYRKYINNYQSFEADISLITIVVPTKDKTALFYTYLMDSNKEDYIKKAIADAGKDEPNGYSGEIETQEELENYLRTWKFINYKI